MQLANKVWNRIRDTHQERGYVCCTIILVVDLNPNVKIFRTVFGTHGNQKDFFLNGIYCLYVCVWVLYTIDYNGSSGDLWVILPENRSILSDTSSPWWSLVIIVVRFCFGWFLLMSFGQFPRFVCQSLAILLLFSGDSPRDLRSIGLTWFAGKSDKQKSASHHIIRIFSMNHRGATFAFIKFRDFWWFRGMHHEWYT